MQCCKEENKDKNTHECSANNSSPENHSCCSQNHEDHQHHNMEHEGHEHHHNHNEQHDHSSMMSGEGVAKDFLRRFYIVTALLIPLAIFSTPGIKLLGYSDFTLRPYIELSIATIIFYFGIVFFQHAWHEIKARQYGMMTLVSMGVGAGYIFSVVSSLLPQITTEFYLEISTLIWILLFGHFLEAKSSSAAGDALEEVAKLLPKKAHKKTTSGVVDVDLNELQKGDVVVVKAGEKIPADGIIVKGSANFNEAHITGESRPVSRHENNNVIAGSINLDGSVEVKLERVGDSSTIGQIKALVAAAQKTKPSAQRLADRASQWLTISALIVSILTLLVWSILVGQSFVFAITLAITVLVIACPHALGLAIPTVSTIATRLAVQNGVFIKNMAKIEVVKNISYVVFDKTGTLTKGEFGVTNVIPISNTNKSLILAAATALEQHSSHVIASAVVAYAKEKNIQIQTASNIKNISGKGVEGIVDNKKYIIGNKRLMQEKNVWSDIVQKHFNNVSKEGKTPVFVSTPKEVLGIVALSDEIKPESKQAIDELHKLRIKVAMLTGDTKNAGETVGKKLNIDKVFTEVLPEDKYKHIRALQKQGHIVLMAGDGVNDAPALTQADVGVAIGAGTDVAVEAGDIVLTQSNPQHIVRLVVLAQKTYTKMVQNLWWALGYNILAIPAAAGLFIPLGFRLTPAVAALLMSLSSVVVVINAYTLKKVSLKIK